MYQSCMYNLDTSWNTCVYIVQISCSHLRMSLIVNQLSVGVLLYTEEMLELYVITCIF